MDGWQKYGWMIRMNSLTELDEFLSKPTVCGSDVYNGKQREIPQGMREFLSDFFLRGKIRQNKLPCRALK